MERNKLNILGISETKVKGKEDEESDGMMIIKSGGEQSQRGVARTFDEGAAKGITEVRNAVIEYLSLKLAQHRSC